MGEVMYQRLSPDYTGLVADIAQRYPVEWDLANKEKHGHREPAFVRRFAWEAHKIDPNIGLNGKRGNVNDPSVDAVAYKNPSAPGGAEVIDIIIGAGHRPAWQDATILPGDPRAPEGVLGAYIEPTDPGGAAAPSTGAPAGGNPGVDVAALLQRIETLERDALKVGDKIALQSDRGKFLCAEGGGPEQAYQDFHFRSRDAVGSWESWKVARGQ